MARYLIIGGVAGGASAAARLRRNDEQAEIVVFERGEAVSYASCGLPYYIGGTISEREKLFVQTPAGFKGTFNIDVRVHHEVLKIDRQEKVLAVKNLASGQTSREHYDKLVLAPGAGPIKPPLPGIDDSAIFTLRSLAETDAIADFIDSTKPRRAVIVGGGFIGLEVAENLHARGLAVTVVEMLDQVLAPLDFEMAAEVHHHLKTKGVRLYLGNGVQSFERTAAHIAVRLQGGQELPADLVLLSIGVRPESSLARAAGLAVGESGGIVVNEYLATADPDIYAVGDAAEFANPLTGQHMCTLLAGPASRQGRIAADNITGGNVRKYSGAINTAVAKVFDLTVACTGASEKMLSGLGQDCRSSITDAFSHAGYYPGAMPMTIKTVFAPDTGRVLGAQAVGYAGVDKRVDLFASVIKRGGTVYDLQEIEHGYAPPYSSARDPVNIAGYAAANILEGRVRVITWDELAKRKDDPDMFLIDVRSADEFALGAIAGAVNIPLGQLRRRLEEVPRGRDVIVYCRIGHRGYIAARILMQRGFEHVYNLSGGFKVYERATEAQGNEITDAGGAADMPPTAPPEEQHKAVGPITMIDASGLQCPGPVMRLKREMDRLEPGARIAIQATDPGFFKDAGSWCAVTGNRLISIDQQGSLIRAVIEKAGKRDAAAPAAAAPEGKTIVVFSDDFDRALASFVIANGAASMGRAVTMFFTFWGLNVIKRAGKPPVAKDLMGRMFGWMMPGSSLGLKLSKMNMLGLGTKMMRWRMAGKKIDSLERLMQTAIENGVTIVACQMSMDVMGVTREELVDAAQVGGVATYLEKAEQANVNLFI